MQIFADARPAMVDSLVLCNTFVSNLVLAESNPFADIYNFLPGFLLKKFVLKSFPQGSYTKPVNDAIDFMVDKVREYALEWICVSILNIHIRSIVLVVGVSYAQGDRQSLDIELFGEAIAKRIKD